MIYNSCGGFIGFAPTNESSETESLTVSELDHTCSMERMNLWVMLLLALVCFNFRLYRNDNARFSKVCMFQSVNVARGYDVCSHAHSPEVLDVISLWPRKSQFYFQHSRETQVGRGKSEKMGWGGSVGRDQRSEKCFSRVRKILTNING